MKIVVLEPLGVPVEDIRKLAEPLLNAGDELKITDRALDSIEEKVAFAKDAEVVIIANSKFPAELIEQLYALRFVGVAFTGYDHVDLEACRARDIVVANCAGYATAAVAELTIALAIGLLRNLKASDQVTRALGTKEGLRQTELAGQIFGLVGFGAIGRKVAQIAQALDCEVVVYNRSQVDMPGIKQVSLDELLETSDIVSLHLPLTDETRGLIDASKLNRMKQDAILINTARGPIVDSTALAEALRAGKIRGAGLDVFDIEPPLQADEPLLQAPNTLLAPHIGFATEQALVKRAKLTFENVAAWQEGKAQNVVS